MARVLSTPVAIVVGAVVIGSGLLFGLRGRPVVYVTTPTPITVAPAGAVANEWRPASAETQAQIAAEARQAIEHQWEHLARGCSQRGGAKETFEVRLIFDPTGKLLSYGVNDPPNETGRELARCLRSLTPEIQVASTGKPVTVQFAMSLQ